jgi:hypothetical protein
MIWAFSLQDVLGAVQLENELNFSELKRRLWGK